MLTLKPTDFTSQLMQVKPVPNKLYVEGVRPYLWLQKPRVAIVGSRKPTTYGQSVTRHLAGELARRGVVIISGLALGIDGIAHRAAIESGGQTVAVLPSSIKAVYPAAHRGLAEDIIKSEGSLISEYGPNQTAVNFKYAFVARNRIIAGLADCVVVTEATLGSGSLHTAGFALELGLPVMAVPGNINSPLSEGTNQLIKTGAGLASTAEDILLALGYKSVERTVKYPKNLPLGQSEIYDRLKQSITHQDQLAMELGIKPAELAASLTGLEINGLIRAVGGGQWVAI